VFDEDIFHFGGRNVLPGADDGVIAAADDE
jgi:hypothetical protein